MLGLFKQKLQIELKEEDITAAHRLPARQGQIKPMIVRFRGRAHKEQVIRARRNLKNSKISINEDLCRGLQLTYNRLRANSQVKDAWAWNSKLFFKSHENKTYRINYGQTIADAMSETDKD